MERGGAALRTTVAALVVGFVLTVAHQASRASVPASTTTVALPSDLLAPAVEQQPIGRPMKGLVAGGWGVFRSASRMLNRLFWDAVDWWGSWFKSALFSLGVAIAAALANNGLMSTWRVEGVRALATYSTLMLYVYTRLLFSSGVNLAPKLLFVAALVYGVIRRDLVPDSSLVPGRVEDVVFIVIATRAFVSACPEELVNAYAARAVTLMRRERSS
jgi:uncharacterized membrane protein YkvA (DUF1232 family)